LELLGKPESPEQAGAMLRQLRGRTHHVYTAIAVLESGGGNSAADRCCSDVPMRAYSDAEIAAYIATGDPLDKAGAYAIQHAGFHPVEQFAGCFASVMGLPLCHLARTLRKLGYSPPVDVSAACQASLKYDCPVSAGILRGEDLG
jgi:MAF protein